MNGITFVAINVSEEAKLKLKKMEEKRKTRLKKCVEEMKTELQSGKFDLIISTL